MRNFSILCHPLLDSGPFRVPHSAKGTQKKKYQQRRLCRVLFVGHSAKALTSAKVALGKDVSGSDHFVHGEALE
jgi:hypothetical protein